MNKDFKNLPSEQLPNDGGWQWNRLIDQANDRLKKIGKRGKRATIKIALKKAERIKPGKPMSAQFSIPEVGQKSYGLSLSLNKNNLVKAEEICSLITGQLMAGTFTMDWFYSLVGKVEKVTKPEKPLTCGEMLEQYKTHYFKQRKDDKNPYGSWYNSHRHIEKTFSKHKNDVINLKIVKEVIDTTDNNSTARTKHLSGLANVLKHFDNNEFKQIIKRYKSENNPKAKNKYIPTDTEIEFIYQTGFKTSKHCPKKYRHRYSQWQFLYSLLATYGLRVHEAWNIKNWTEPVILKAGVWIAIDDDSENTNDESEDGKYSYKQIEQDRVIPAILDPNNEHYLLCIGHDTKTGYRVAFPVSPNGIGKDCDWIQKFNIVQPMNLPDIPNPLGIRNNKNRKRKCTDRTTQWFNLSNKYQANKRNNTPEKSTLRYGFTAHALRHAYNIRGHKLGVNQKALADSLGHGLNMNSRTYMKHEQGNSKIEGIELEVSKQSRIISETEKLQNRIKYLEDENKYLKTENNELKTKLAMYEAIKPDLLN